jgi:hypothetical protein
VLVLGTLRNGKARRVQVQRSGELVLERKEKEPPKRALFLKSTETGVRFWSPSREVTCDSNSRDALPFS